MAAGAAALDEIAARHGFSAAAAAVMHAAIVAGHGRMAQFTHPEFGGSGQWMRGGMTMLGSMFDASLRGRVERFCEEIALLGTDDSSLGASASGQGWWPSELGHPDSTGAQNEMRYAYFAAARRLLIGTREGLTIYDTRDHRIAGVAQQQSQGGTLAFISQHGSVDITSLPVVPYAGSPANVIPARCRLRPHRADDSDALVALADDFAVARWMTHRFPHPYTHDDAREWLTTVRAQNPVDKFAVEVEGELAGGVGIAPATGESFGVAEFGYWLGRRYWRRGVATDAALACIAYAFDERRLRRLEAHVFAGNAASVRVLEKCGFVREAVLRQAYVERDGSIVDGLLYARVAHG